MHLDICAIYQTCLAVNLIPILSPRRDPSPPTLNVSCSSTNNSLIHPSIFCSPAPPVRHTSTRQLSAKSFRPSDIMIPVSFCPLNRSRRSVVLAHAISPPETARETHAIRALNGTDPESRCSDWMTLVTVQSTMS
ncbi:hypothetical protein BDV96DRAFT_111281 [Lophiotrema nucula]|uniref:Uncharacterized protein n=1 Tax=Lophiotrema nucula TaxID=690887 RepID=A0A6A5Z497_9PLEO|nr:hypothetical protein BDV96DRAFT_111281 [Lophiotrema nucula]